MPARPPIIAANIAYQVYRLTPRRTAALSCGRPSFPMIPALIVCAMLVLLVALDSGSDAQPPES